MNYIELIRSWNIPANNTLCSCWAICVPKEITLHPGIVNEINIPFKGNSPKHILHVKNHMNDKPWKIINEYIWFNEQTHLITIPIITHSLQSIKAGEPICHIRLTEPEHILQNIIKGWYFIKKTIIAFLIKSKHYFIIFFFSSAFS